MDVNHTLELPAELTITNVAGCYQQMMDALQEQNAIVLDDSKLQRIDTSGIQLLVAFIQESLNSNKAITWTKPSELITECAEQLGLSDALKTSLEN